MFTFKSCIDKSTYRGGIGILLQKLTLQRYEYIKIRFYVKLGYFKLDFIIKLILNINKIDNLLVAEVHFLCTSIIVACHSVRVFSFWK